MNRLALALAALMAANCNCGDSHSGDAGVDASEDAGAGASDGGDEQDGGVADAALADAGLGDGGDTCSLGTASSFATGQNLDLFGTIVYFGDGNALPPGRYSVRYLDGCMKYGSAQGWTIHAYADGHNAWWLVGASSANRVVMPPGTIGWSPSNGAFAAFEDCVAANLLLPTKEFDFAGGPLGVWLLDSPYSDNLAGVDNRNPKWELTRLAACDAGVQ